MGHAKPALAGDAFVCAGFRVSGLAATRENRRFALSAGLLLCFFFVAFTVLTKQFGSEALDRRTLDLANSVAGGRFHTLFEFVEPFGSPLISSILALALAVRVAIVRGFLAGLAVLAALGLMTLIEGLLRVRLDALPWEHLTEFAKHPRGWRLIHSGYPSGHTARLALLAVIAAVALARRQPWWAAIAVVAITFWIGVQRVEAGRHSGADVIGGALLAWAIGLLYAAALPWFSSAGYAFRARRLPPERLPRAD